MDFNYYNYLCISNRFAFPYFFSNNIRGSLVYVGTGLVIWFYYSMTVRDCCEALTSNQSIIFSRFIDTNFIP